MKELDFLPQSFHKAIRQQRQLRRNVMFSIGVLIALGSLHVVNQGRIRSAEACLNTLQSGSQSFENARVLMESLRARKQLLAHRDALLDRLEDATPLDAVMGEITRLMENPMAIRSLEITAQQPKEQPSGNKQPANNNDPSQQQSPGPQSCPFEVRMTAVAANDIEIGKLMGRLSTCPIFENVQMVISRETQQEQLPMREFELMFTVKRVEVQS